MQPFEITTPALKHAISACGDVLNGVVEGGEAKNRIGAANAIISAVGTELKVRLAAPKIAAMEAKLIEGQGQKQQQIAG